MKQTFSLTFYSYKYLLLLLLLLLIRLWPCLPPQLRVSLSWLSLQHQQFGLLPREHVQLVGASEALQVTIVSPCLLYWLIWLMDSSSPPLLMCSMFVSELCVVSLWSETILCSLSSAAVLLFLVSVLVLASVVDLINTVTFLFPAWWPAASCSAGEGSVDDYLMEYLRCVFVCV